MVKLKFEATTFRKHHDGLTIFKVYENVALTMHKKTQEKLFTTVFKCATK